LAQEVRAPVRPTAKDGMTGKDLEARAGVLNLRTSGSIMQCSQRISGIVRAYVDQRIKSGLDSAAALPLEEWDDDRYNYRGSIREGTQSEVEIYLDTVTDRSLAVRQLWKDDFVTNDEINSSKVEMKMDELDLLSLVQDAGVCSLNEVYRNAAGELLLVSEWMPERDLFSFSLALGHPGPEREKKVLQMLPALLDAVERLHKCGIAHCNLCVENAMLLESSDPEDDRPIVLLSDFTCTKQDGLASSALGPSGKAMYVAPEAHVDEPYDARSADLFACGVIAYSTAIGSYPWVSTVPKKDKAFTYFCDNGLEMYLQKRMCCQESKRVTVGECMSPHFRQLLSLLWSKIPEERSKALALAKDRLERP
jgi:serine/threonine protein kinase